MSANYKEKALADAEFIAHSRNALPILLEALEDSLNLIKEMKGMISAHEYAIRADAGNTNWTIYETKLEAFLEKWTKGE